MIKMKQEKASSKKTKPKPKTKTETTKVGEFKKFIITGGLVASLAIVGLVSGFMIFFLEEPPQGGTLIVGITGSKIGTFDPLMYVDSGERILLCQVAETLFEYEYIDDTASTRIINNLAIGSEWNANHTEFTCFLREGVKFHDGTPFDAAAVKWNFDRIFQIIDPSELFKYWWGYLFFLPDWRWIINKTQVIDPYTVKFVLNDIFVPFEAFLTHPATSILSPTATPPDNIMVIDTDKLVGTGPFIYNDYDPNVNISLSRNQYYWGLKPKIDKIIFSAFPGNLTTRLVNLYNALLTKKIHMIDDDFILFSNRSIESLKNNPGIMIQEKPITNYQFIGMNTKLINTTMRKAISYAIDYSSILNVLPNTITPRSLIPEGIRYSNTTAFEVPYYNITKARQILIDVGWPGTENLTANDNITAGNEWEQLVTNRNPLATYNLSYIPWHVPTEGMSRLFPDNLKQIGVNLTRQIVGTTPYIQLDTIGWHYDYDDPHNGIFIDYHSKWTLVNLNDSVLDHWIEDGIREIDPILREQIYYNIQKHLIEVIYPVINAISHLELEIYASNVKGWQLIPFKTLLKSVYFG
jgi:ABC-type transport system substrate-binding protein